MVNSQARRDQVALAMERGRSQRQACELIELPRSILKYRSLRAERDAPALGIMGKAAGGQYEAAPSDHLDLALCRVEYRPADDSIDLQQTHDWKRASEFDAEIGGRAQQARDQC
jgi:hypothetical protein